MTSALQSTLGNFTWVDQHKEALKALLPLDWTPFNDAFGLPFMYRIKLLGIDYRSDHDVASMLAMFETSGLLLHDRDSHTFKVNPTWEPINLQYLNSNTQGLDNVH